MTTEDPWTDLRRFTAARLALGRSGASLPTSELLRFGLAHAQARDAVHVALDVPRLVSALSAVPTVADYAAPPRVTHSLARDRAEYLLRPDLGRRLPDDEFRRLASSAPREVGGCDLLLVIGDGLSSRAVQDHAAPLVRAIHEQRPPDWQLGPLVIATQSRVALGDPIGEAMRARMVAILIGERPGLSSPDSLGIYLTWQPRRGCTDAQRNCLSNVRPQGLGYAAAAARLWWLCGAARSLGATGVALKDDSAGDIRLIDAPPPAAHCR